MINLIPTPKKYEITDEAYHTLANTVCVAREDWRIYAETFKDFFFKIFGTVITDGEGGFELLEDPSLASDAYRIESAETFKIYASAAEGLNYGLASAYQLAESRKGVTRVQTLTVEDFPEKEYRAFMADVARVWHPFNTLLHYVDICHMTKTKYLHLHMIEDQLYTLPSRLYPRAPSPGQHYSFEEIAHLNAYAKARNVTLIPEYECPGHSGRLVTEYPEIFQDALDRPVDFGDADDRTICASDEGCWEATKGLIAEVCSMFPDAPYINLGGDEANIAIWNSCRKCRAYMEAHGLKNERELLSDYIARVTDYVLTLGKTPMVWEGFRPEGCEKISRKTIVLAWESTVHLADNLLKEGFRVINASFQPLYISAHLKYRWRTFDILNWDVHTWQCHDRASPAHLNPIRVAPTEQVMGAMLCDWGTAYEMSIQHVIENLAAVAERLWTVKRVCYDEDYISKFGSYYSKMTHLVRER